MDNLIGWTVTEYDGLIYPHSLNAGELSDDRGYSVTTHNGLNGTSQNFGYFKAEPVTLAVVMCKTHTEI